MFGLWRELESNIYREVSPIQQRTTLKHPNGLYMIYDCGFMINNVNLQFYVFFDP